MNVDNPDYITVVGGRVALVSWRGPAEDGQYEIVKVYPYIHGIDAEVMAKKTAQEKGLEYRG